MNTPNRSRRNVAEYDMVLIWLGIALLSFGLVMVYSASIDIAEANRSTGYHSTFFLSRQLVFIVIGLLAGYAAFQVPVFKWQRLAPWLFLGGLALLVLVLVPGIG
ncbi:MAG TPA: FtsW/RodA/SpoVE family cell cycle protein, partial [Burkholderiales bacterium]|nr:FtsW/RodA/SpoVE family cell cycle protein [Burkholderiales bacterium]